MIEYVKKDDILEHFCEYCDSHVVGCGECPIKAAIDEIPVITIPDNVKVLCGKCGLWDRKNTSGRKSLKNYRCACLEWSNIEDGYYVYTSADEYCSRGEKNEK